MSLPLSLTLPPWVGDFFDASYASADLAWPRSKEDAVAARVIRALSLAPSSAVLDQCCGIGGLTRGLARQGHRVVAMDQSTAYVARGQELAAAEGLTARWYVGDAGSWRPPETVDAAVNWHSSIGYGGEEGGEQVLSSLRCAVRPHGRWLVEVVHRVHLDAHFQPHRVFMGHAEPWGEVEVHRFSRWAGDVMHQDWEYRVGGRTVWERTGTRCWHPPHDRLAAWIAAQGDSIVAWLDTETGDPLSPASPRLMVVVEKGDA